MGRTVKKYLQYWLEKRPDCSHEYVFCVENGDPLTGNALKCVIDRLKISSEITRLFPLSAPAYVRYQLLPWRWQPGDPSVVYGS